MATNPTSKDAIARVKARLAELRKRQADRRVTTPAAGSALTWPRDLNEEDGVTTVVVSFGADPTEDAGE